MKWVFVFGLSLVCGLCAQGQDSLKVWRYVDLNYNLGGFSSKSKVSIDAGESSGWFKPMEMLEDEKGKAIKFNSPMDALNYMSVKGWELVLSYIEEQNSGLGATVRISHFVMKRKEIPKKE